MSHFSDSRDPNGVGFFILQDHGYKDRGLPDAGRGGLVGVRVMHRRDAEGEDGKWNEDEHARGNIGNWLFWGREKENAGGWSQAWSVAGGVAQATTISGTRTSDVDGDSVPSADDADVDGGGGGGNFVDADGDNIDDRIPRNPDGTVNWIAYADQVRRGLWPDLTTQQRLAIYLAAGGGWGGNGLYGPGGGQVFAGQGAQNFGVFGLGVNPFVIGGNNPGGGAFGLNLGNQVVQWVFHPDPGGNPVNVNNGKNDDTNEAADQADANPPQEDDTLSWMGPGFLGEEAEPTHVRPAKGTSALADARYNREIAPVPFGWPDHHHGTRGIMLSSSDEEKQVFHFHPTDPRLVAANHDGPTSMGSLVCDLKRGFIDTDRQARLHSAFRVIRAPSGDRLMLRSNRERRKNWLAWNLGPSGRGDVSGGLVVDLPTGRTGTMSSESRILAHLSVLYGGPLDVGHYGDDHRIGADADGNPINACHISTDALFKRRGSVFDDFPLLFETQYPYPGELPYPVQTHLAPDHRSQFWRWWSTASVYKPRPPVITPGEPPPEDPGPTTEPPGRGGSFEPRQNFLRAQSVGLASTVEHNFTALSFRAQFVEHGRRDLRYEHRPRQDELREFDRTAPLVARLDTFAIQTGGEFDYFHPPGDARWPGGVANGGVIFSSPNMGVEDVVAAPGVDGLIEPSEERMNTQFIFLQGTALSFGGLPLLDTGVVAEGSAIVVGSTLGADLVHYDVDGDVNSSCPLSHLAQVTITNGSDFTPATLRGISAALQGHAQVQVGVRLDAGNESIQVNIGGTVFKAALTAV